MNDAIISIHEILCSWLLSRGKTIHSYVKAASFATSGVRELSLTSLPMLRHAVLTRVPGKPWFTLPAGFAEYTKVGVRFGDRFRPLGVANRLMAHPQFGDSQGDLDSSLGDDLNTAAQYDSWYAGSGARPADFNGADFGTADFDTNGVAASGGSALLPVPDMRTYLGDGTYPNGFAGGIRVDAVAFDLARGIILCYEDFPYEEIILTYVGIGSVDNMTSIPVIAQAAIEAFIDYRWAAVKRNNNADARVKKDLFDEQHFILRARKNRWTAVDIKRAFATNNGRSTGLWAGVSAGNTTASTGIAAHSGFPYTFPATFP